MNISRVRIFLDSPQKRQQSSVPVVTWIFLFTIISWHCFSGVCQKESLSFYFVRSFLRVLMKDVGKIEITVCSFGVDSML